jgi:hypothetical protein
MGFVENLGEVENSSLHFRHSTHPCVSKTNNHLQIMAIVLIKSDSAGFFVQISSQNHGAAFSHQVGESQ